MLILDYELVGQLYDTLLSEQFSTHFGVRCVVTRSILKHTDAITKEYRQELCEMLFFCQRLHISESVKWSFSYTGAYAGFLKGGGAQL